MVSSWDKDFVMRIVNDYFPKGMLTKFGLPKQFELRRCYATHNGKGRRKWVVMYPDRIGRDASEEEVRLWTALPNSMTTANG